MARFTELELTTLVTGMHLIPELGNSIEHIRQDGFPISEQVPLATMDNGLGAWSRALGNGISGFADALERLKPDIVLLSGDRVETTGCCIAATYMGLPIAHIQAGDKSGHVDDLARMAIAKLAHIHLASCEESANRLRQLGEQNFRIYNVGAPQLDNIIGQNYTSKEITIDHQRINLMIPYILLVQHPILVEHGNTRTQIRSTLDACISMKMPIIWIYPNSDLGFQEIVSEIESLQDSKDIMALKNLEREDYLRLLANAAVLVGNSSSGILEAPSFKVPVVNIGNRQRGRQQASNIVNCENNSHEIARAIDHCLNNPEFKEACILASNPYGEGNSGQKICEIIKDIPLDNKLLDKQTTF